MAGVGDRVQVPSKRVGQAARDGVVTGVSGTLLRVTWSGGEESTISPSMGSLVVVGKAKARAKKGGPAGKSSSKKGAAVPTKKSAPTEKMAKGPARAKRAGATKSSSKGSGGASKRRK